MRRRSSGCAARRWASASRPARRGWRTCRSPSRTTCASTTRSGLLAVDRSELRRIHASSRLARAADRRRLHAARPRRLVGGDGLLHGHGGRAPRHDRPQRLRLRALHRRARLPPGRRAPRRADDPGLRRRHRPPGAAAARPAGAGAVLARRPTRCTSPRACARRASARTSSRWRSACSAPSRGRRRCAPSSRPSSAWSRSTSTGSRRSSAPASPASARARDGLHVMEDHFLVEVIDPDSGEPVPDGTDGELVFTTLTKEAHAAAALPHRRHRVAEPRALRLRAHLRPHERRSAAAATTC